MAYADNVNHQGGNTDTIQKTTETLIDSSMAVCLEINAEKTKYTFLRGVGCIPLRYNNR
jgi:hypothetical protein